ncbi:MAG TPA: murein biosynthesis integral membrane protein MurJ [Candidatus Acidoferrales bacterium]|nr:murein biosynthesis integral membrane protein MurJ [Candidatus Acidoferrales bacterium]
MTEKGKLLKSASVIALATVISRICGYLRDQRVALLLGTSPAADSFILAFRIPNMIRRMTGEGALGASFIPVFTGYLRGKPQRETWQFAQRVFWDVAVILTVIAALGCVFSSQIVGSLTLMGVSHARWDLAIYLNRIIFPCVFFLGLAALAGAILNSFHRFGLPASTSILFNVVFIAFSFGVVYRPIMNWAPPAYRTPAVALAFGIVLGAALQLAMQLPALAKLGMRFRPDVNFADAGVKKVGKLMVPVFFGMGVFQINFFVDTIFAASSRMPEGSISSLYIADRLMELVLGSYAIALSTALLPTMSHQVAEGKHDEMKQTFAFALRVASFITIPAAVGLILLRVPITQVLFEHGEFMARSTSLTAHALLFYSLGLPAFAAIKLITPMYYSTQDTLTPTKVGAYSLVLHVALNIVLLFGFGRYLWNASPALASSLAAYFNFAALFVIFRGRYGSLGSAAIFNALGKMALCAVAMSAVCFAAVKFSHLATLQHFLAKAAWLIGIMVVSVGIYFALAWALRCEELPELFLLLRRAQPTAATGSLDVA